MQYRPFGKTGDQVSVLGFGCMRFQTLNNDPKQINEEVSTKQIRDAIDAGVNYIDTAWVYHGGESESFVGRVLQDGYREKVFIATKLPSWLINKREDMDYYLNQQLKNLQTETIDYYLIHALNKDSWANLTKLGLFDFIDQIKKDGRVRFVGFSFHDEYPVFKEILDSRDWDFTQIQLNYMDENYQAGVQGLNDAAAKGIGVVIMEPLRGGVLANNIPEDIMAQWHKVDPNKSPVQWALDYVWNYEAVSVLLSGMNQDEHIQQNIKFANESLSDKLTLVEKECIEIVKNVYRSRIQVPCTACQYCMPCPVGVDIPGCFSHLNQGAMYNDIPGSKYGYMNFFNASGHASHCIECGACETKCPQNILIREELKKVIAAYGE